MKQLLSPPSQGLLILHRALLLLALLAALVLITGTIYGFIRSPDSAPLLRIGGLTTWEPNSQAAGNSAGDEVNIFTGISRLRIPLAGGGALILSVAFPYPAGDSAFTEELAARIGEFRAIAAEYFSALPSEKLVDLDEDAAKQEILRRYNAGLRLGKIETLYFNDLMIF